ncbi:MAG: metallophosphoesterase, partial [Endomicrobia bacterium]|nr:metallophosphoesterase [Endomicrobiia bacterium]
MKKVFSLLSLTAFFSFGFCIRFVHMADTHCKGTTADNYLTTVANDINSLNPPAEFVVISGDVTEFGTKGE